MEFEPSVGIDSASMVDPSLAVDASSKYVTVSNGARRVEAPDGEGYLMQVEAGPANGIPDGRYDLSKAIEARAQGDRTYDGQVIHKEGETVYQMAGHEFVKHSLFEIAKEKLPEIGAQVALTYAGGLPHVDYTTSYTAASAPHAHKPVEQISEKAADIGAQRSGHVDPAKTTTPEPAQSISQAAHKQQIPESAAPVDARAEVRKDLEVLFSHDPRGIEKYVATTEGSERALSGGAQFMTMEGKVNRSMEYATELKRLSPDLFDKMATADTKANMAAQEKVRKLVEGAERVDQAKTLAGKDEKKPEDSNKRGTEGKGEEQERERRGFAMPDIATSVEARAAQAREALAQAHSLAPMFAAKQIKEHAPRQQAASNAPKATNTQQQRRGRSR